MSKPTVSRFPDTAAYTDGGLYLSFADMYPELKPDEVTLVFGLGAMAEEDPLFAVQEELLNEIVNCWNGYGNADNYEVEKPDLGHLELSFCSVEPKSGSMETDLMFNVDDEETSLEVKAIQRTILNEIVNRWNRSRTQ